MEHSGDNEESRGVKRRRLGTVLSAVVAIVVAYVQGNVNATGPYVSFPRIEPVFDTSGIIYSTSYLTSMARELEINLISQMVAADEFCADRRFRKEDHFWEEYNGDSVDFYKSFRMSRITFNGIVKDCIPYLYDKPTNSLASVRRRYISP